MKRNAGFTVIELFSALVVVLVIASLVIVQKNTIDATRRDQDRKTAVNAMYYGLKNAFFLQNNHYPTQINPTVLPYIDPTHFKLIGDDKKYKVTYRGLDCKGTTCQRFELRVPLEKEATYIKKSE
jgi:type II secretory pathway pseudopilin PulG